MQGASISAAGKLIETDNRTLAFTSAGVKPSTDLFKNCLKRQTLMAKSNSQEDNSNSGLTDGRSGKLDRSALLKTPVSTDSRPENNIQNNSSGEQTDEVILTTEVTNHSDSDQNPDGVQAMQTKITSDQDAADQNANKEASTADRDQTVELDPVAQALAVLENQAVPSDPTKASAETNIPMPDSSTASASGVISADPVAVQNSSSVVIEPMNTRNQNNDAGIVEIPDAAGKMAQTVPLDSTATPQPESNRAAVNARSEAASQEVPENTPSGDSTQVKPVPDQVATAVQAAQPQVEPFSEKPEMAEPDTAKKIQLSADDSNPVEPVPNTIAMADPGIQSPASDGGGELPVTGPDTVKKTPASPAHETASQVINEVPADGDADTIFPDQLLNALTPTAPISSQSSSAPANSSDSPEPGTGESQSVLTDVTATALISNTLAASGSVQLPSDKATTRKDKGESSESGNQTVVKADTADSNTSNEVAKALAGKLEEVNDQSKSPVEKKETTGMPDLKKLMEFESNRLQAERMNGSSTDDGNSNRVDSPTPVSVLQTADATASVLNKIIAADSADKTPVDMKSLIEQVVQNAELAVKANSSEMKIQLEPEFLGKLTIKVAVEDGLVTASFTTDNHQVKHLLESNLSTLRQSLEAQGIKVDKTEVNVQLDSGGTFAGHEEGRQDLWQRPENSNYRSGSYSDEGYGLNGEEDLYEPALAQTEYYGIQSDGSMNFVV